MIYVWLAILGYLIGCIHGSQIVGKLKKVDFKNTGTKNAGASNTTIVLGWKYGIIVALIDIGKAVIPILVLRFILSSQEIDESIINISMYLTGLFTIIGHNYPITMRFSGGKGTASLVGMLVAIDWKIGLIGIGALLLFTFISDYLVIGVAAMYLAFLTTTWLFDMGLVCILISAFLLVLSLYKHIENYQRIVSKTETKLSSMFKRK